VEQRVVVLAHREHSELQITPLRMKVPAEKEFIVKQDVIADPYSHVTIQITKAGERPRTQFWAMGEVLTAWAGFVLLTKRVIECTCREGKTHCVPGFDVTSIDYWRNDSQGIVEPQEVDVDVQKVATLLRLRCVDALVLKHIRYIFFRSLTWRKRLAGLFVSVGQGQIGHVDFSAIFNHGVVDFLDIFVLVNELAMIAPFDKTLPLSHQIGCGGGIFRIYTNVNIIKCTRTHRRTAD
jgi:hypothetical protein